MDVKYLNYILTIAKKRNMTKAAEELFVSQSSLSQYLSRLEQEIGAPLFIRAKGELLLTPAGEEYVKAAQKVIQIQRELYDSIRSQNHKSHITIGVTSQFGLRMLTQIIPPYKKEYPQVTIELSESNVPSITKMIRDESIDCAVMALNNTDSFSPDQVKIVREEEVYLAIPISHPYREKNPGSPIPHKDLIQAFGNDNFLLSKKGSTLRTLADQIFFAAHFKPSTMCETNSIIATRAMVASGIGVTFIAHSCVSDKAHVAYYSLNPPLFRVNAVVHRKNWIQNQPEKALLTAMNEYFNCFGE